MTTFTFTAFREVDLLQGVNGGSIGNNDQFTMPALGAVVFTVMDDDPYLSGDTIINEQSGDTSQQTADIDIDGARFVSGAQFYAERSLTLQGSDGNTYTLIEIEVVGVSPPGRGDDFFAFLGAAPPAGVTLTVTGTGNVTGDWVEYSSLGTGNEAPVVDDQSLGVVENSAAGTVVGTVAAGDPNAGDPLTFAIVAGNDSGAFAIDAQTGEITVADVAALDFEATPQFSLTVEVTDLGGLTDTAQVTVDLADVFDQLFLESLDPAVGTVLSGWLTGESSGYSVSSAGDVNNDGLEDFIIGAPFARVSGQNSGINYIVYGSEAGFNFSPDINRLDGSNGFYVFGGAAGANLGRSVSSAGDVNGDGIDDLIIGAADQYGFKPGQAFIIYGAESRPSQIVDVRNLDASEGFVISSATAQNGAVGYSVSAAGDVNADGIDDLIIGSNGARESYVVFGSDAGFGTEFDLDTLDGSNGFVVKGGTFEVVVSDAGDINGDGIDDIIIGDRQASPNGINFAGASYVVFGTAAGFAAEIDLATLDGSNGFAIDGISQFYFTGWSVSGAGDVNGDGIDDVMIGAPQDTFGPGGVTYVIFGSDTGFSADFDLSTLDGSNGFVLTGPTVGDNAGWSVSAAGDVNGDGIDDMIIGAVAADPAGNNGFAGESYVVYGTDAGFPASIDLNALDGTNGFTLSGVGGYNFSGRSVSAGDLNGDGFSDLIVGESGADPNAVDNAGDTYVVYGGNFTGSVSHLGTAGADSLTGTAAADIMVGAQGDDTLASGAGDDLMTGAAGADMFVFDDGDGLDTVRDFTPGTDQIDITAFAFADFGAVLAAATDSDQGVEIALDADDRIVLQDVTVDELAATDFLL